MYRDKKGREKMGVSCNPASWQLACDNHRLMAVIMHAMGL